MGVRKHSPRSNRNAQWGCILAKQIVTRKRNKQKLVDWVPVDNGRFYGADNDDSNFQVPFKVKDGLYPVYLSADGNKITIDITPSKRKRNG